MRSRTQCVEWLIVTSLCLGWVSGCSSAPAATEPPTPKVTVQHPETRELVDFDEYNGWTEASATVEVRSRVRGHVDKVHFKDGDVVQKDAPLFELDPRPFQSEDRSGAGTGEDRQGPAVCGRAGRGPAEGSVGEEGGRAERSGQGRGGPQDVGRADHVGPGRSQTPRAGA